MGAPHNPKSMSFSLPPGSRFYPSEEQLLCYYLTNKTDNTNSDGDHDNFNGCDLIKVLDLYEYNPFELPDSACFAYGYGGRKRHWYCYTVRALRDSSGRIDRRTNGGYWRRRGRVRDVMGPGGSLVLGTRTRFVFYLGNLPKSAVRTGWVMYEYSLLDHAKASFVLCRMFVKSRAGNSLLENVLSYCAEESVSAVRHIGIQHDGFIAPDVVEDKACNAVSITQKNDISRYPVRLVNELHDHFTAGPAPVANFQFPTNITRNELVRTSELTDAGMFVDAGTAEQLLSILEEDFIELDDLVN